MYLEERSLSPYPQPLVAQELEQGSVYFDASFLDRSMLIPCLEPYVFIGRDLDPEAEPGLYFQDFATYSSEIRFETATQDSGAIFIQESEKNLHLFDYESALDQLLWCSLRWQGISKREPILFEGRLLSPQAKPIPAENLEEGPLYFSLVFQNHEGLIPSLEPYIFLGKDLKPGDSGRFYFQDFSSHRKGVRFGADTEIDQAHFLAERKDEVDHFFEYDAALEELMRCSLQRREAGLTVSPRRSEKPGVPGVVSDDVHQRSLRFEDPGLQERLISELRRSSVSFEIRDDNAVVYANADALAVGSAASIIRDSCFRGYFFWWKDDLRPAHLFWERMKESGLPHLVEHHDDRLTFFLPKGSEDLHDQIVESLSDAGSSRPVVG